MRTCWCGHAIIDGDGVGPCKECRPRVDGGAMSEDHADQLNLERGYAYAWYEPSWCMEHGKAEVLARVKTANLGEIS